ncbi:MAG: cell division protein CrgA [Actinomycetota bacterium]|jgi:hypothetical protein
MPKSRSKRKRRQPPPKPKPKQSPPWVGALFFTLMAAGIIIIIGNYLSIFPGGTANWRLYTGLAMISGSFIVATQWH